jgi:hypothetical protein
MRRRRFVTRCLDLLARALRQLQAEGHVVEHGHVRVQRVVLEHHRDVALLGRDVWLTTRPPIHAISPTRH